MPTKTRAWHPRTPLPDRSLPASGRPHVPALAEFASEGFVGFRHILDARTRRPRVAPGPLIRPGRRPLALALAAVGEEAGPHVELDERPEHDEHAAGVLDPAARVGRDLEDRLELPGLLQG